ncbi:DUF7768 domain-containing protein [Muriventricola aceti]|jgi:hypothetical protein|uniref:DUF7768 domain-containing protein n=1 Tax=Muriventricola aceti TaxID=2981773 RepID=UPI0008226713|nr:DUF4406 domain-containing protein [Muriventricola aceti]MBS6859880.1 DUF4406 domain-containing protein [Clostridiales bacterium]MCU6702525.1 DUF4406 domain-containing protein [Muriventricola aceti]SCJ08845.1 Uncharacterised protein [uncultured Flavonifractor sp.]
MKKSKLIYIASPYAGDIEKNVAFAQRACRYAIHQGYIPIAVHLLYPQMLDDGDPAERELGLQLGQQLLRRCDELWVCGDRISSGMAREISEANQLSIPVKNIDAHDIQKEQLPAEMEQVTASGQALGII